MHTQHTPSASLLQQWQQLLTPARSHCKQQRSWQRLQVLSCGLLSALGRHTLSQVIVTIGAGEGDWSAWYRQFNTPRIAWDGVQQQLVGAVATELPAGAPFAVALDATTLPRTSATMPAVQWVPDRDTPPWQRGIRRAQRWVGLSALLPRSAGGDSRAVPLRLLPAPAAKAQPLAGHPPLTEAGAGLQQLAWLRQVLDRQGQQQRRILAVADGAYSSAGLWAGLPERTVLLARCAKNRALYALPQTQPQRGRKRLYGERLPTPEQYRTQGASFQRVRLTVRDRRITLQVKVVGPLLVRLAANRPLFLLVVKGYYPKRGGRTRREPTSLLVNAKPDGQGGWRLPLPVGELLNWAWQRWEVEVMHRELKSGFGLGQQQQWSDCGVVSVVPWITWLYATLVLAGYRAWGYNPPGPATFGCWWQPRRWSLATLWQAIRQEVWQLAEFQPVWARSPDIWGEIQAWFAAPDNTLAGFRAI